MEWWTVVLIGVAVAVIAVALWFASRVRRDRLRTTFGSEYDRTVEGASSRRDAEGALRDRLRRHRELELQPLEPDVAAQYAAEWMGVQIKFVDTPDEACLEAERLLDRVLRARGYPVEEDFDSQADLVSVDHPELVAEYRRAHETLHGRDGASRPLEEVRAAFVAYRGLFSDVLDDQRPSPAQEAVAESVAEPVDQPVDERQPQAPEPEERRPSPEVGRTRDVA
jgi:hypothetical protein